MSVLELRISGATLVAAGLVLAAQPALAQEMPVYRDDRSSPQALVESLYNAVGRQEYARAFSYFEAGATTAYAEFAAGYAETARVRARVGEGTLEGAAGSLYGMVPAVVEASGADGAVTVFAGCYETRQVQPGAQIEPPFEPIRITAARLAPTTDSFADAVGACPSEGL